MFLCIETEDGNLIEKINDLLKDHPSNVRSSETDPLDELRLMQMKGRAVRPGSDEGLVTQMENEDD